MVNVLSLRVRFPCVTVLYVLLVFQPLWLVFGRFLFFSARKSSYYLSVDPRPIKNRRCVWFIVLQSRSRRLSPASSSSSIVEWKYSSIKLFGAFRNFSTKSAKHLLDILLPGANENPNPKLIFRNIEHGFASMYFLFRARRVCIFFSVSLGPLSVMTKLC